MLFKTTNKAIRNNYSKIIEISYCAAQNLLRGVNRIAYTSGVYGWNADLYEVNGVAIVTGYRPIGNIHPDYDLVREYDQKAEQVNDYDWDVRREKINNLLEEFVRTVTKGE